MTDAVTAPSGQQQTCKTCGASFATGMKACATCGAPANAPEQASGPTDPGEPPKAASAPSPAAAGAPAGLTDLEVGETLLGQWQLESKIGEGGMGNVFLATELKLSRKVAVKALFVDQLQDETVKRFEREAQVMGKLDHPNIVTLYAVGRHREVPFLVMRYLEGGSLWDLLDANGGRLTPEQLVPVVKQLCAALGYIHGKNLIHRDLKPSNVFISPQGKVTVLDLGLARGHTTAITRTGIIWGTPDYMAPEQIVGERQLDGRADLYSLGVVLYRMISNEPPFPDEDEQGLMRAHLTRDRPDITKVWPPATVALSLFLKKAMAIKPEERFQTADELAQAFERVVSTREQPTNAAAPMPQVTPPTPAPSPSSVVLTRAPVVTPQTKGKVVDGRDDDRTELGELPLEMMGLIGADDEGATAPKAPEAKARDAKAQEPRVSVPKRQSQPRGLSPAVSGTVPDAPAPNRRSGVTAYDRTPSPRSSSVIVDEALRTVDSGGTLTDVDSDTGPQPLPTEAVPANLPAEAQALTHAELDDDDAADMKTVVGASANVEADGASTVVYEANSPEERTPVPKVSAPRSTSAAQKTVQRRSNNAMPSARKEPTGAKHKRAVTPAEEPVAWLHPYVLVTGGLLLLAVGFLIGVLLR